MRSPKTLTIQTQNPSNIDHYNVLARKAADNTILASANYPCTGATVVAPIGSDTFFQNVADSTLVNLSVIAVNSLGQGPEVVAPGGPFTVGTYPDDALTLSVQL